MVGGFLLLSSRNRFTAMLGGWLTVLAGAWFIVGRAVAGPLGIGDPGTPVAANETKRVVLDLTYFYGLGALIIFLGAIALGRLSVRSVRDIRYAERTAMATTAEPMATTEPAPSEDVTEIQPAEETPRRHRPDDQPLEETRIGDIAPMTSRWKRRRSGDIARWRACSAAATRLVTA